MKKIILSVCALVLLSVFHISCNKDDFQPNKKEGTVEFGFSLKVPSNSGAQKSSMKAPAAEPAAVVVSIKKANGNSAYTMQRVELYNMNGYYISKPLSLLPGSYTVEQFFVVDAAGSVMYASPIQGSPKAYLVSKPLPIGFSVGKDVVTKVVPEVLSTANSTPEDFGYTTFSFDVVNTFDFLIGVFVYNETVQNFELTTANLTVAAASKTIFTDSLAAITNKVTLNDGYDSYLLTVTKDGYKTWTDTLTAAELKLYFRSEDKGPLEVILEKDNNSSKAIWFVTDQSTLNDVSIFFIVYQGDPLTISWGDGSPSELINSNIDPNFASELTHSYLTPNQYTIKVWGNSLQYLHGLFPTSAQLTSINVDAAENLEYLNFSVNKIKDIDVSKNLHLKRLIFYENLVESIDLSKNKELELIDIIRNKFTSLDVSLNVNLEEIGCQLNNISTLDVTQNLRLQRLNVAATKITTIDISNNRELKSFHCWENNLNVINISNNTMLEELYCYNCQITSLNITNNTKLTHLKCDINPLTNLDLSKNIQLKYLFAKNTKLTSLDLINNREIRMVNIRESNFTQQSTNSLLSTILSFKRYSNNTNGNYECAIWLNQAPTGQGLLDMQELRDTYKWYINIGS